MFDPPLNLFDRSPCLPPHPIINECSLIIPESKILKYRDSALGLKTAPELWNTLPENLQSTDNLNNFKSSLVTHLHTLYYTNDASFK